jgi:hypothetical protein
MMMFQGGRGFIRVTLAAGAGLSCLALAACGGSASSAASGSVASGTNAASATSTADPLAGLSAAKVQAETVADAKAASSLTLKGSLTQSGQGYTVDLGIKPGHGCAGTIGEGAKGSFKIIEIGKTVYINPDDTFWKTYAGASAGASIALVGGRYLKGSTSDNGMASMASLCDVSQMFSTIGTASGVTKGAVTTLNGVRVLPLNSSTGIAYVTDTSKPDLIELTAPGGSKNGSGLITVTTNSPVTLTAPPASQVVDGSKLGM